MNRMVREFTPGPGERAVTLLAEPWSTVGTAFMSRAKPKPPPTAADMKHEKLRLIFDALAAEKGEPVTIKKLVEVTKINEERVRSLLSQAFKEGTAEKVKKGHMVLWRAARKRKGK